MPRRNKPNKNSNFPQHLQQALDRDSKNFSLLEQELKKDWKKKQKENKNQT